MNRKIWGILTLEFVVFVLLIPLLTGCGNPIIYDSGKTDLLGVWGSSSTDVFVVGESGTILHYDGKIWEEMLSGTDELLCDIWGTSSSDVFAVSKSGAILHYDGSTWGTMTTKPSSLRAIWGTSSSDIFAVGGRHFLIWNHFEIWHYDGSVWSLMYTHPAFIGGVWGSSSSDVYATAYDCLLHYDGNEWREVEHSSVEAPFGGVWGTSSSDVFATKRGSGDEGGTIWHYDGSEWQSPYTPQLPGVELRGIWGSSSSDVYAVGGGG